MFTKFTDFILRRSLFVIVVIALISAVALFSVFSITFNNSIDVFFDKGSESYSNFEEWKEQFGSDQVVIVAFSDRDIFSEENIRLIDFLTNRFELLTYVDNVHSLTSVNDIIGDEDNFIVETFIDEIPSRASELRQLRERALKNPLYRDNIISRDGRTTALIVELEKQEGSEDIYKRETIEAIQRILEEQFPAHKAYYVSGLTAIEYYYARYMHDDFKAFLPFIFVIIAVILLLAFRSISAALLLLLSVLISLLWTMGFLAACGISINNVTTIVPPVLLAIAVADSIHFVGEAIQRKNKAIHHSLQSASVVKDTIHHLFAPCFLTSLTTAIGFISLTVSRIVPVRELGLVVAVGALIAFVVTFTFLPAVIERFGLFPHVLSSTSTSTHFFKVGVDQFLKRLSRFSERNHRAVRIGMVIVIALSALGIMSIKTETSVLEYFKKDSPIYTATKYIENHLSGVHFLNISLRVPTQDYFREPDVLKKIERLQYFVESMPEVDTSTSVVNYIQEINKSFHDEDDAYYVVPESRELIAQYLLLYGATDLEDFVNADWNWTTIRIRLNEHTSTGLRGVIEEIDRYLTTHFQAPLEAVTLGQTTLEVESNETVTKGQVNSLVLAMIVIFGMMFIVFRSVSIGFVSILANALPLIVNFGIMGLCAIRLNSATSMIAAIGIGIIVDDTIHFIHRFREAFAQMNDARTAVYETIADKGRPIILTSVILFFGFGVVAFSRFVPTMYFGILSALLMFNALWADLIVLPSILLLDSKQPSLSGVHEDTNT